MPSPTMTLIASSTVPSGGAASIDFTSIPSTYTDLQMSFSLRSAADTLDAIFTFNGSSGSDRVLSGNGSAAGSFADASTVYSLSVRSSFTANTFGSGQIYIPNYAGSNYKSISQDVVTENNATASYQYLTAALFSSTSAINRITVAPTTGNFAQFSTAYLYGIRNS